MGAARARGTYAERKAAPLGPQLNHKVDAPLGRYVHKTENKFDQARRERRATAQRVKLVEEQLRLLGRQPVQTPPSEGTAS